MYRKLCHGLKALKWVLFFFSGKSVAMVRKNLTFNIYNAVIFVVAWDNSWTVLYIWQQMQLLIKSHGIENPMIDDLELMANLSSVMATESLSSVPTTSSNLQSSSQSIIQSYSSFLNVSTQLFRYHRGFCVKEGCNRKVAGEYW